MARTGFATHASPVTTRQRRQQTPTSSASAAAASHPSDARSADGGSAVGPAHAVYFFGAGKAEGTRDMKAVLGGKGANLAEMTNLGVPVPPGFTIACSACVDYLRDSA